MHGSKIWFFPDGDLPPHGGSEPHGHESLVILNPNLTAAHVQLTLYFEDSPPKRLPAETVDPERVRCIRMDEPIGDYQVPAGQYALKLEADTPIICQIGRMDVRQPNLAYYTVMGHPA